MFSEEVFCTLFKFINLFRFYALFSKKKMFGFGHKSCVL